MAAAVLFQPVLMGRPRQVKAGSESSPDFARSRAIGAKSQYPEREAQRQKGRL
jgi:hypothetical protein